MTAKFPRLHSTLAGRAKQLYTLLYSFGCCWSLFSASSALFVWSQVSVEVVHVAWFDLLLLSIGLDKLNHARNLRTRFLSIFLSVMHGSGL